MTALVEGERIRLVATLPAGALILAPFAKNAREQCPR